jgi:hypothetical protein
MLLRSWGRKKMIPQVKKAVPTRGKVGGYVIAGPFIVLGAIGRIRWRPRRVSSLQVSPVRKNAPGDPGQFIGQRNREHVAVKSLFGGFNPRLEPVSLPALRLVMRRAA